MKPNKQFKPTRFEMELLEALWKLGPASIREVQESLPEEGRPEYTTVQTIMYRLEEKGAVERMKKIGNAHIFRPLITRKSALGALVEDFLGMLGGSHEPLMAHLAESGRLSLKELKQLERLLKEQSK